MAQFEIDKAIDSLIQTIDRKYEPEKIILFGSRSRGDAAAGSDLDLLVIKQTEKREVERIREVSRLVRRFRRPPYLLALDILVKTPGEVRDRLGIGDDFMREICERGRAVYERGAV